jgi:multiple sugar transport system substrate-binding protein
MKNLNGKEGKMKKLLLSTVVLLIVSLVVSLSFVACKEATEEVTETEEVAQTEEAEEITLKVLLMSQAGYSEEDCRNISDEFMGKNPNVKVDQTYVAYDNLHDKIITSFAGGDPYDVVLTDTPWPAEMASAGFFLDITDRITDEMKEDIWPNAFKAVIWQDRYYAMPWLNDVEYFFYNERLLKEAGFDEPPQTWSELIEQSKVLKEKGIVEYPYIDSWMQGEILTAQFTHYLYAFGGDWIDKDMNPLINQEGGVKALEFMVENMENGYINQASIESDFESVRNVVSQGNAAFCVNFSYVWQLFNDPDESNVVGDMKIGLMPGEEAKSVSLNGGMGLGISSSTKYPEEAWAYVEYMSSKDIQARYAKNALPIWSSLFEDSRVVEAQPDLVEISKEQYKYIVNRPIVPWYEEFSRSIQIEVHNALIGDKTPQQALDDVADKILELREKFES